MGVPRDRELHARGVVFARAFRKLVVPAVLAVVGQAFAQTGSGPQGECLSGEVEVSGRTTLSAQCVHRATLRIRTSDTMLDCAGSTIDGEGVRSFGVEVESGGRPLTNVEIRNCRIVNARYRGVTIAWGAPDSEKARGRSREALYAATPSNVRLVDLFIDGAGTAGVYVDDYVSDTLIARSEIRNSGGVAVYVEHSSRRTVIRDSVIANNGGRLRREGVAIDSSQGNQILHNTFVDNFGGGIYVYRNCSEHLQDDPKQVTRWMSADNNAISGNDISGGKTGIWIASRQSADISGMKCGNGYYAEGKYTLDSARNNVAEGNVVRNTQFGIIVEDDGNRVLDNRFTAIGNTAIKVGSVPRAKYLDAPVKGVELRGNRYEGAAERVAVVGGARVVISGE